MTAHVHMQKYTLNTVIFDLHFIKHLIGFQTHHALFSPDFAENQSLSIEEKH